MKAEKPVKKTPVRKVAQAKTVMDTYNLVKSQVNQKVIPPFSPGDKIVVKAKIKEGDKERVQAFEGIVIARSGSGIRETFTVRKVSSGVGVERIFPINSPAIESVELMVEGFVRRSKLYYLRDREGRSARIQDKNLKNSEAQGTFKSKTKA
jgi:large subunit ribosomal protein L19